MGVPVTGMTDEQKATYHATWGGGNWQFDVDFLSRLTTVLSKTNVSIKKQKISKLNLAPSHRHPI
jgi:hypothetical protein